MFKNLRWTIRDKINHLQLERFNSLTSDRISADQKSHHLNLGDNLLFFNPVQRQLSRDGYLDYQTPSCLLNDETIRWKRRVWARGEMKMFKPLKIGQEYDCQEKVKFLKKVGSNYYVSLERLISDSNQQKSLCELRTLVYTNSPVSDAIDKLGIPGEQIGTFKFSDLDIVTYGHLSLNSHRVHWDRNYCQEVEGYKDIIVQGPFAVQILMAFARHHFNKPITNVSYKNVNFIYPETEMEVCIYYDNIYMRDKYFRDKIYVSAECFFH